MPRRTKLFLVHALLVAAVVSGCSRIETTNATAAGPSESTAVPTAPAGQSVVVLELFTSQGCSSCPPADRVLSKLGHDESLRGRVVPLAFHVDYWNYIGWADPFSSADWSERQETYKRAFKADGVYTPQIVVNGQAELNGSDEASILRQIDAAAKGPAGLVTVAQAPEGANKLSVQVEATTPDAVKAGKLDAIVVVYESGITTSVRRGENSGRTLENDYVVRRLERAFSFKPEAGATRQGRVTIDLDKAWTASNVGVVAFLQDPDTMRIYGAAVAK